jgi:hypothetical protein
MLVRPAGQAEADPDRVEAFQPARPRPDGSRAGTPRGYPRRARLRSRAQNAGGRRHPGRRDCGFALQRITGDRTRALVFSSSPRETEITNGFSRSRPDGPLTAGNEKDAAKQTADDLPLCRFDLPGHLAIPDRQVISFSSHRTGKITAPGRSRPGPLSYPDHLSGPDDIAGSHPQTGTFPQVKPLTGDGKMAWPGLPHPSAPGNWPEPGREKRDWRG